MKQSLYWLCAALVITALYATVFVVVQAVLRGGANDPQIQLAEDAAAQLGRGAGATSLVGDPVDIGASLAPFVIVYDRQGNLLASSGRLNGQVPLLPTGVLASTAVGSERKVTWQPQPGVRIASVVVANDQGYVLSGRSLREVERRIGSLEQLVAVAWALSCGLLLLTFVASRFVRPARGQGWLFGSPA
ncbi:MAG: hypothetical protein U0232_21240 [Thermomicrobiales bacterium]